MKSKLMSAVVITAVLLGSCSDSSGPVEEESRADRMRAAAGPSWAQFSDSEVDIIAVSICEQLESGASPGEMAVQLGELDRLTEAQGRQMATVARLEYCP